MTVGPVLRDDATAAFFDGAAAGQFLLRRCSSGHWSEPAAETCTSCGRTDLSWEPASGEASVVTWAVVHGRTADADADPRTVVVVAELAEGPWWWSQITGVVDAAVVRVGLPLRVAFQRFDDQHEWVPVFELREAAGG